MVPQRIDQLCDGIAASFGLGLGDLVLGDTDQLPSSRLLVHSINRSEQVVGYLPELHARFVERLDCQLDASIANFRGERPAPSHNILKPTTLGRDRFAGRAVDHTEVGSRTLRNGGYIGDNLRRGFSCRSLSAVPGVLQCRAELQL